MKAATSQREGGLPVVVVGLAGIAVLFCLFYLYIWLCVNPRLLHHRDGPVFLTGLDFLEGFLTKPGGPVEYVSLFFWQLYYYPWIGAVVITLIAGAMCLGSLGLMRAMGEQKPGLAVCLVPAVLLLLLHSRYSHDPTASGQILLALASLCLYARVSPRSATGRLGVFLVMSAAVYYLGGGGYVLFAGLCGLLELLRRRQFILGALFLLCGACVPYLFGVYSYEVDVAEAYGALLPLDSKAVTPLTWPLSVQATLHVALVSFFPLVAIRSTGGRTQVQSTESPPGRAGLRELLRPLGLLMVIAAIAAGVSLDRTNKTLLGLDCAARHGMRKQVLAKAEKLPGNAYSMYVMKDVNSALYHTGRLPYEMFAHPQRRDGDSIFLVFATPSGRKQPSDRLSEMYFELGFVNEAEHHAHEALEQGRSPEVLKRLARINILKGLPAAGRAFIRALGEDPLHRKWAQEYLRRLDADPLMTDDEGLTNARKRMVLVDDTPGTGTEQKLGPPIVQRLEQRLKDGNRDRMAFEYLMSHYLLTRQLDKVAAGVSSLHELGYLDIPKHYEEAMLLHAAADPANKAVLQDRHISSETTSSFARLLGIALRTRQGSDESRQALIEGHNKSYFLYHALGFSDTRTKSPSVHRTQATGSEK